MDLYYNPIFVNCNSPPVKNLSKITDVTIVNMVSLRGIFRRVFPPGRGLAKMRRTCYTIYSITFCKWEAHSMYMADQHTHSDNSPDAENSVMELCESAVAHGISCFTVTDHCEIDRYREDRYEVALRQSFFDVCKAQNVFRGQVELLAGVELGNSLYDLPLAEKVAGMCPYDLVLGSLHHPKGVEDFAFLHYETLDVKALLRRYFDELYQMADWGGFDVLAHLTYPLRYIVGEQHIPVDLEDYREPIERVLRRIVARGIGLEINVSGLRQPYGRPLPDLWCLQLYRALGGCILTVGSDSHRAADLGSHLEDGLRIARRAGFESYCIYRKRKPEFVPIDV